MGSYPGNEERALPNIPDTVWNIDRQEKMFDSVERIFVASCHGGIIVTVFFSSPTGLCFLKFAR